MSNPVCQTTLAFHSHTQITARFDGGNLTSDAGWLLFGSLDRQDRLCEDFSSCIADSRDQRYVRHEQLPESDPDLATQATFPVWKTLSARRISCV